MKNVAMVINSTVGLDPMTDSGSFGHCNAVQEWYRVPRAQLPIRVIKSLYLYNLWHADVNA